MTPPLHRSIDRLTTNRFDVAVVGGGIYGLIVACDAAQRGLSVALVERHDFGSGTTFNHLRTIHGGLRYLQTFDLRRARESIRERRTLARVAPWAVRPLPFVLPLPRSLARGPLAMRAAFLLDSFLSADRNEHVPDTHGLPAGHVIDAESARSRYPELQAVDIAGAAIWHDYVTVDADRLTLAWGLSAAAYGAVLANYVEATRLLTQNGQATGLQAKDRLSGREMTISATTVVNATGAAIDRLLAPFDAATGIPLLQAVNIVTTRPAPAAALGGRSLSGQTLFVVPWQGRAVFGTWESPTTVEAGDTIVRHEDLLAFLDRLNEAFPTLRLTVDDVALVHRGVVPALITRDGTPTLDGHELIFEHRDEGLANIISVAGTKYTTARAVAERIVDRVIELLGRPPVICRSGEFPLPEVHLAGDDLLRHAAANEMVVTLADAVMRRTTIGAAGRPDRETLEHAASIVGAVLGWSAERFRDEVAAVERLY